MFFPIHCYWIKQVKILNFWSVTSLNVFKENLLKKFIRSSPKWVFDFHKCKGIKYLIRLCLGLIYLPEDKFEHTFQDTLNPLCLCDLMLKQICIFYFTAPCLVIKDAPSWAQLMILIVLWQILLLYTSLTNSIFIQCSIYLKTPSYLMQQWIISYPQTDLKKVFFSIL